MPDPISAGMALIGGIGGAINAGKTNRKLSELFAGDPAYAANPLVSQQLALSKTLLNARMPGATYAQGQILQNEANQRDAVARNATDGSQLLAEGSVLNNQTNNATLQLGEQEAQDYQRRYGNVVNAAGAAVNEGDKVFQDKVRRLQDQANVIGAQAQNNQGIWNSLTNLGLAGMNLSASR